jgi:cell division protein FtsA
VSKKRIISAIDIGDTKISTFIAEVGDDGQMRVAGVGIVPSKGMHKGTIANADAVKEAVRASVKIAEQSSGYKCATAYWGINGHFISGKNDRGVVAITHSDHLVRSDDIRRVLQVAQVAKIGNDQKILHVVPRHYLVDNSEAVGNPVGMHTFKLDAEIHVITAPAVSVQELIKCAHGVQVDVEDFVFSGLASSEAVLTEDDKQTGTIVADIGGGITDITVFKDGSILHTAVIPAGGNQVTEDITAVLNVPFEVAEELKKKYGVIPPPAEEKEGSDIIAVNGHNISRRILYDVIRARVEELLRLVVIDLPRDESGALVPGGLVLTGGGANLPGIEVLGQQVLKMPVRVSAPLDVYRAGDQVNDPAYSTAIGLLLWNIKPKSHTL